MQKSRPFRAFVCCHRLPVALPRAVEVWVLRTGETPELMLIQEPPGDTGGLPASAWDFEGGFVDLNPGSADGSSAKDRKRMWTSALPEQDADIRAPSQDADVDIRAPGQDADVDILAPR